MLRIRLAYVEHSQEFRIEWQHATDFFTNEGKGEDDGVKSFVEKLTEFRADGREVGVARTIVEGIIMPTERLITILTQKKGCDTFVKLEAAVQELIPQYDLLFNHTDRFADENPGMDVEAILEIKFQWTKPPMGGPSSSPCQNTTGNCLIFRLISPNFFA